MAKEFVEPKEKTVKCKGCKGKYHFSDIVWNGYCRYCAERFGTVSNG